MRRRALLVALRLIPSLDPRRIQISLIRLCSHDGPDISIKGRGYRISSCNRLAGWLGDFTTVAIAVEIAVFSPVHADHLRGGLPYEILLRTLVEKTAKLQRSTSSVKVLV